MSVEFIDKVRNGNVNLWSYLAYEGVKLSRMEDRERQNKKCKLIEDLVKWSKESFYKSKVKIYDLLNETKTALKNLGYEVKDVEVRLKSRGLYGTSSNFGKLIFEVGLSLDPIINVPYIPGSSLKGAVRASYFVILRQRGYSEKDAERECNLLFGSHSAGASWVGFTDAYPIKEGKNGYILYPDIMTPHYKDVDTELDVNPIPLSFLTVAPGTHFRFFVFQRRQRPSRADVSSILGRREPEEKGLGLLDLSLLLALKKGIGAKTTLGYSTFEIVKYE